MKHLIHEIHRRSLWQVLGIYLAVSWVVLQVVDVVGNNFGLPDWVAPAALVLLLLGLPIVVATAFVQEGMSTKEPEAPAQSLADVGEVPPSPAPEVETHRKLLTWRNALIGGGAAFALLVVFTGAYLFMRSTGIGPAGTLVAQGVLTEGADVLLADFESADEELAGVVTGALRIDLAQSPTIRLVPRSELDGALRRMQLEEDARITSDIAIELAEREGIAAVVHGDVGTAGSGYVLTASIVSAGSGEVLAGFRETARGDDNLIDAIENLSRDIRDKAGESLRTVNGGPPLRQVSTPSLEALRLYTQGEAIESESGSGALAFYEQAVAVDPEFAMAHRKIGVMLDNAGLRRDEAVAALTRAYELRDKLPPAERYLAEAYYHSHVSGDLASSTRAYERLLAGDPRHTTALNNLSILYADTRRLDESADLLVRALDEEKYVAAYQNLARVRVDQGDLSGALEVLEIGAAELPGGASYLAAFELESALGGRDYELAGELATGLDESVRDQPARALYLARAGNLYAVRGEFAAAEDAWSRVGEQPVFLAHPMRLAALRGKALLSLGDSAGAAALLRDELAAQRERLTASDLAQDAWLPVLLDAGGLEEARAIYDEWRAAVPTEVLGLTGRDSRRYVEAVLAIAEGRVADAMEYFRPERSPCSAVCGLEAHVRTATLLDRSGNVEGAIGHYTDYVYASGAWFAHWVDVQFLPGALERLGELHDARGDAERAAHFYTRFADLWADADAVVQPRVQAARTRAGELAGSQ